MIKCRYLNPCFPHRVVRAMSPKDRRLYMIFHACLWSGVLTFAIGTGLYAALRTYAFFIMAPPCLCVMFAGQFGFRWLAMRNGDKFEMFYPSDSGGGRNARVTDDESPPSPGTRHPWETQPCNHGGPPPPPVYTEVYDGPIFTIEGSLAPPPGYSADCPGAPVPKREGDDEIELSQVIGTSL